MPRKPVIVVTGPSGAGKGTLISELLRHVPDLEHTISATTREKRPGEENGREYWFLTPEEFKRRVQAGEFLEHVTYVSGKSYGTLRSEIERVQASGKICVLELETEGALAVKHELPEATTIFISAGIEELERRLSDRATETSGEINDRLRLAREQLAQAFEFDYIVVNDSVERATRELEQIVRRKMAVAATMES
jgi:guanylate kinase